MQDRYARYGAGTGALFVLFVIAGFLVRPKPPAADATAQEMFNYVVDKQNTLHIVQLLFAFAGVFFIWFIGTLRQLLSRAEGNEGRLANTAFGGGLILASALLVGGGLEAAAALHPVENGANLTHALIDAAVLIPAVAAPAGFVFFTANGLSFLRSGYLPAWMGWFGIATAVLSILGIGAVFTDHGVFAGDGLFGFFLGFLCFLLWSLLASGLLYRKLGEAPAPGPA
jgi:hypothetical protein